MLFRSKVYKNFKERPGVGMKGAGGWAIEGLHGGTLLGARGNGFVMFWDWETGEIVRRIDVDAKNVSVLSQFLCASETDILFRCSGLVPAH